MTFTAHFEDGTSASVSPQAHTPSVWGNTAGTQTCTFTYTDAESGESQSCAVEATVIQTALASIAVTGTPADQHSFTNVNASGLTVTGTYNNGTTADVTSSVTWTSSQTNGNAWDACLYYDDTDSEWKTDDNDYHLIATVGDKTANSSSFKLLGKEFNGSSVSFNYGEYDTFDFMKGTEAADPWDGASGGYMLEGASIGDLVWMLFTKSQYDNDTGVDITAFGTTATDICADLAGSSTSPAFGLYGGTNQRMLCISTQAGGASDTQYVLVEGKLNHAVTAGGEGTIQKSYFDYTGNDAAFVFNITVTA